MKARAIDPKILTMQPPTSVAIPIRLCGLLSMGSLNTVSTKKIMRNSVIEPNKPCATCIAILFLQQR